MGALPYLDLRACAPGRDVPAGFEEHFQPRAAAGGAGRGRTEITGLLDSDDTRVMLTALRQLGVNVSELDAGRVTVEACGAFRSKAQSCSWATPAPPFVRSPPRWP